MFLTAVDDKYLDEAQYLIKSCARHAPKIRFHLFLVNSSNERVAPLRQIHPNLEVRHVTWERDASRWRGIMCCARSIPIAELIATSTEPVIYLDSDIIMRKSPAGLLKELDQHDLLIRLRPNMTQLGPVGTPHAAKFNSGVIAIRPNPTTIAFAEEYNNTMRAWIEAGKPIIEWREEDKTDAYIDQEFLYLAYEKFKDRLSFKPLPDEYNDAKFHAASTLWHGKGRARRHPAYRVAKMELDSRAKALLLAGALSPLSLAYKVVRAVKPAR